MRFAGTLLSAAIMSIFVPESAWAHFLWVVAEPTESPATVKVFFSESAEPDDAELLKLVEGAQAWALPGGDAEPRKISLQRKDDALVGDLPSDRPAQIVLRHTYGISTHGGGPALLEYYGKTYPSVLPGTWRPADDAERLPLEIVPALDGGELALRVLWQGKPLAGAAVVVRGLGDAPCEGDTDQAGRFRCPCGSGGLVSVRARHVEPKSGQVEGKDYQEVRHYTTLALRVAPAAIGHETHHWPELPRGITSFGSAVGGDFLYVYGGHFGRAHHYSTEGQSGEFLRLNLREPRGWETLPGGPKRTGLAMVAHGGKLYRIGGFEATNADEEEQRLFSRPDFACFDPANGQWEDLPPLPEGRSSHAAAVVGDRLYVVGGWELRGQEATAWHETAWTADLSARPLRWEAVPAPPFRRRALAAAAWQGKLYCLGGMQQKGGPTTAVGVFDPQTGTWSEGPSLLGSPMDGFGAAAHAVGESLFASTMSGAVQRLAEGQGPWQFVGQLDQPRFFHGLLPWNTGRLVAVGGASMEVGKIQELECVNVGEK